MGMSNKQILERVRHFAKQAKASGTGWHTTGDGTIQCKHDRCTLGAIAYSATEKGRKAAEALAKEGRKLIAEFNKRIDALEDRAEKVGAELCLPSEVYMDDLTVETQDVGDNPLTTEAVRVIDGLTEGVACAIIDANDTPLADLAEGSLAYRARQILEEVLLNKKAKK